MKKSIVIVGAGLSGSLLAIYLAKRGYQVKVFEHRKDIRLSSTYSGRSINMALSTRGINALREVGLDQQILGNSIPMKGRMIHSDKGQLSLAPYGRNNEEVIYSISRAGLNASLMDVAEKYSEVTFEFEKRCLGIDLETDEIIFKDVENGKHFKVDGQCAFDTEGATSAIRCSMLAMPRFNFSQNYLKHSYKELTIPPGTGGVHQMEKQALHIWPKGSYMLIALPNLDGSFTCTLFLPQTGPLSFENLKTPEAVRSFFKEKFPDALEIMPDLTDYFFKNPTGDLMTVKCFPWHYKDKVLLVGDAAHALVPFYGQGMNCSFEDCTVLNQCIGKHGDNWELVFRDYENLRKENTDAIADLALDNFVEMRDLVADPKFVLKRDLEHRLEDAFPGEFISKYSMVTFSNIPYIEAMRRGRIQDDVLKKLCCNANSIKDFDLKIVKEKIESACST